jgi:hypothetical protein
VATDSWPEDFDYISNRLTTEIVQQHAAASSGYEVSWNVTLRVIGLSIAKRRPDYRNRWDLARRATDAVLDNTGTIAYPGDYVRGELDMHKLAFPVHMGWADGVMNGKVALLVSDETSREGRSLVALFGSIGNYVGHAPSGALGGFFPSDMDGLFAIIEGGLEKSDPRVDSQWLSDENARYDDLGRIETATRLAGQAAKNDKGPTKRLQFLAKVHYHLHNTELQYNPYKHVVIGAAVWAATPPRRPFGTRAAP